MVWAGRRWVQYNMALSGLHNAAEFNKCQDARENRRDVFDAMSPPASARVVDDWTASMRVPNCGREESSRTNFTTPQFFCARCQFARRMMRPVEEHDITPAAGVGTGARGSCSRRRRGTAQGWRRALLQPPARCRTSLPLWEWVPASAGVATGWRVRSELAAHQGAWSRRSMRHERADHERAPGGGAVDYAAHRVAHLFRR